MKDKEYMSWQKFDNACVHLVRQINNSGYEFRAIHGVPRGGLVVAVRLSHLLNLPLRLFDPKGSNPHRILVVDDILDSGKTLLPFKKEGLKIAALYFKPGSEVEPDFYVHIKKEAWIVFPWER